MESERNGASKNVVEAALDRNTSALLAIAEMLLQVWDLKQGTPLGDDYWRKALKKAYFHFLDLHNQPQP